MRMGCPEVLERRQLLAAPVIGPITGVALPANEISVPLQKSRLVPITASDADGDAVSYTVTTDRADVSARILRAGTYLKFSVARQEAPGNPPSLTPLGDMVFQLLPEFAPQTVSTISNLVNSGFYTNLKFHRVVPNFVIQGGDPNGNGSGGPGFQFDDEFHPNAVFSGDGQLAMANSGKDTNGSQFFITSGPQRLLDFNHAIYGQLLRGFDVFHDVIDEPLSGSTPVKPIVITSASFIENTTDAVLLLESKSGGFANVTLVASDGTMGGQTSTTFRAVVGADSTNDPPILGPVANRFTSTNTPITFTLSGTDLEGDAMTFSVDSLDTPSRATIVVTGNTVKVTPSAGFRGELRLRAKVKQAGSSTRGSTTDPSKIFDTEDFVITVSDQSLTPEGVNVVAVAGAPLPAVVARFTAQVPVDASNFTATIQWGDGSTTPGVVVGSNGSFEVRGAKTYFRFGTYPVNVAIRETGSGMAVTATSQAVIADAPLDVVFGSPTVAPGTAIVSGPIAAFASANSGARTSDLSAIIEWGDGSASVGTITGGNGIYAVSGAKTYATLGVYTVKVKVMNAGGAYDEATGTITVANRAPILAELGSPTVQAGSALNFIVGAIDPDAGQSVTFRLAEGAPAGATIDPTTGAFSWTPSAGPASSVITVIATDNGQPALSSSRTFVANVTANAPVVKIASSSVLKKRNAISSIRLVFSGDLDGATFGPFSDLGLVKPGRDRKIGTRDDVVSRFRASRYDAATRTLTLTPRGTLSAAGTFRLRLNGVADRMGRALDTDGDGIAGGGLVTITGRTGAVVRSSS